jgi:UDP-3-O-[3-hydroxymyristoyl] glucosamine N-acyltransferase
MTESRALSVQQIAQLVQGKLHGEGSGQVTAVSDIEHAGPGQVSFFANRKYLEHFLKSQATAIFVPQDFEAEILMARKPSVTTAFISVPNPVLAFAKIAMCFIETPLIQKGVDQRACISATAKIHETAVIFPFVYVGDNVQIGARSVIYSGVHIGPHSVIGEDCVIHPNATIYEKSELGNRVVVKSGATVGSEGFGFTPDEEKGGVPFKVPQMGNVRLSDDVEIGANSTIDRATMGTTIIGRGTKIDNLVHVAHNCIIGENTIICAQCGVSGSTTIGNHVIFAGHVGTKGHVTIGDHVTVAAQSGISKDIAPHQTVKGYPPRPLKEFLRMQAAMQNLPEYRDRLIELEKKLATVLVHLDLDKTISPEP